MSFAGEFRQYRALENLHQADREKPRQTKDEEVVDDGKQGLLVEEEFETFSVRFL